jgi:hypothetical protein
MLGNTRKKEEKEKKKKKRRHSRAMRNFLFVARLPFHSGKSKMRSPGIEPGSITWQATIITTRPRALSDHCRTKKLARRRWNRTTGTLIPHGFEVQALNLQSSSTQNVPGVRIELTTFGL